MQLENERSRPYPAALHEIAASARRVRRCARQHLPPPDQGGLRADVSVVPRSFLGRPTSLDQPKSVQLVSLERCHLNLLGTFPATLAWRGWKVHQKLYVGGGIDTLLLGYAPIVALPVVHFVDSITNADLPKTTLPPAPTPPADPAPLFAGLGMMPDVYHICIKPCVQ